MGARRTNVVDPCGLNDALNKRLAAYSALNCAAVRISSFEKIRAAEKPVETPRTSFPTAVRAALLPIFNNANRSQVGSGGDWHVARIYIADMGITLHYIKRSPLAAPTVNGLELIVSFITQPCSDGFVCYLSPFAECACLPCVTLHPRKERNERSASPV